MKNRLFYLLFLLLFCPANLFSEEVQDEEVIKIAEKMPVYPGGSEALFRYLSNNIKYPIQAAEAGIEGRVVTQFVISSVGKVTNAKIVKSLSPECDAEALRVVSNMSAWTPAKNAGKNVAVQFTLPITFKLQKVEEETLEEQKYPKNNKHLNTGLNNAEINYLRYLYNTLVYPEKARKDKIEGFVYVDITVGDDGKISDAKIEKSLGEEFDAEVLRIVNGTNMSVHKGKKINLPFFFKPTDATGEKGFQEYISAYEKYYKMPVYPGGSDALMRYLASNIKYPVNAAKQNIQGKVILTLTIAETGSVENVKVIQPLHPECDAEARRVVAAMPKWMPGKRGGKPIKVEYTLPITFMMTPGSLGNAYVFGPQAEEEYKKLDYQPSFPGGAEGLVNYLAENMKYPESVKKKKVEGEVLVQFVVNEVGLVKDIKVVKSLSYECDKEARRLVREMPRWKPGIKNKIPVAVQFTIPVTFKLNDSE